MQARRLGRTDLLLSIIGFGAAPLGNVFGTVDAIEAERAVHYAIDRGVNFFDVSPYYGQTLAETRLGQALRGRRERVLLSTKCGRYGIDEFDFSPRRIRVSLEESLRRLQADHVDLLLAHDIEFGDLRTIFEETLPEMRGLQREGKARFIGVSGYPLRVLEIAVESESIDAVLSYCHFDPLSTDLDDSLLPAAKELQVGLINASPLHMGLLSGEPPPEWHPAPAAVKHAGVLYAQACRRHGLAPSSVALHFCLQHQYVSSTLIGMSTERQVRENLEALDMEIPPELHDELVRITEPVRNQSWPSGHADAQGSVR